MEEAQQYHILESGQEGDFLREEIQMNHIDDNMNDSGLEIWRVSVLHF